MTVPQKILEIEQKFAENSFFRTKLTKHSLKILYPAHAHHKINLQYCIYFNTHRCRWSQPKRDLSTKMEPRRFVQFLERDFIWHFVNVITGNLEFHATETLGMNKYNQLRSYHHVRHVIYELVAFTLQTRMEFIAKLVKYPELAFLFPDVSEKEFELNSNFNDFGLFD